ncbi:TolB family protein, partial [Daejeonella sp.]|uniref:TolB family protein n=1 Tax=Daejeonella sp. TaxID=2805397 RepID=UPI0037BF0C99
MKRILIFLLIFGYFSANAQELGTLSVDKIMRDPKWMGVSPSNIQWDNNSRTIYFNWNPDKVKEDPLYQISIDNRKPQQTAENQKKSLNKGSLSYSKDRLKVLFERNGDIFVGNISTGQENPLTNTLDRESNPVFSMDETKVFFQRGENLFSMSLNGGSIIQLSNFTRSKKRPESPLSKQDQWLRQDQINEFDIIQKKKEEREDRLAKSKANAIKEPKEFYLDDRSSLVSVRISPDEKYIAFRLMKRPEGNKNTIVPNYVTESGYTEDLNTRTKVGNALPQNESYVYDLKRDTIYALITKDIPGIKDLPDYVKDYPKQLEERKKKNEDRQVSVNGPFWNADGSQAVVVVSALDNKDRWIMKLDQASGKFSLLDRQRDEAWIGGPGIGGGNIGWTDLNTIYFQSEATGYSHI